MSDQDKQLAITLVDNEELFDFVAKILLTKEEKLNMDIVTLPDEQVGQIVKADMLAEEKIKSRINKIKIMAQQNKGVSHKVPR